MTLVKPTRSFEDTNVSLVQSKDKNTNKEPRYIISESWENLRRQLGENSETPSLNNILHERTLGDRLIHRSRRSVVSLAPINTRKGQLLSCKLLNYNLAILDDGTVHGIKNQSSPSGM
jgi:hypothetical protein